MSIRLHRNLLTAPSLPPVQLQLVLWMLKAQSYRARLIFMGMRDLLEELQTRLDTITPQDSEIGDCFEECWQLFNNF